MRTPQTVRRVQARLDRGPHGRACLVANGGAGSLMEPPSGGKYLMSTGSELITLIASRQNLDDYQKKHWTGSFGEYLDIVQTRSQGHPDGLPADLRHDHSATVPMRSWSTRKR